MYSSLIFWILVLSFWSSAFIFSASCIFFSAMARLGDAGTIATGTSLAMLFLTGEAGNADAGGVAFSDAVASFFLRCSPQLLCRLFCSTRYALYWSASLWTVLGRWALRGMFSSSGSSYVAFGLAVKNNTVRLSEFRTSNYIQV